MLSIFFAYVSDEKNSLANFLHIILESSKTHFDLGASKIGAKLNFSSKIFVEKSVPETQNGNYVKQKISKKIRKLFLQKRIFWNQNSI